MRTYMAGSMAMVFEHTEGLPQRETSESLRAAIVAARKGDREAFDTLILHHQRQVIGVAWRLLGHREDAKDAAQDVFIRLFRHIHRFDPTRELTPWLYRVTVNVCRDLLRRRRSGPAVSITEEDVAAQAAALSTPAMQESVVTAADERRRLKAALAVLTEKERVVVVLRDIEGLDMDEIARVIGASQATVRTHLCRGRLKLRAFRSSHTGEAL